MIDRAPMLSIWRDSIRAGFSDVCPLFVTSTSICVPMAKPKYPSTSISPLYDTKNSWKGYGNGVGILCGISD
eukprot:6580457-Ditylum_brightwellii.AAC.1